MALCPVVPVRAHIPVI